MNTAPHYYKLCSRISYIWGTHRGQHIQSEMDKPHSRKIIFIIIIYIYINKTFNKTRFVYNFLAENIDQLYLLQFWGFIYFSETVDNYIVLESLFGH